MSWLEKNPCLSIFILIITHVLFGWSIYDEAYSLINWIMATGVDINLLLEKELVIYLIHLLVLIIVIFVSLFLTTPVALITFVFKESIGSDIKATISVLLWSFFLVLIICYLNFFANLLVIISAGILVKLDLQKMGFKKWQVFLFIIILSSLSFSLGAILRLKIG